MILLPRVARARLLPEWFIGLLKSFVSGEPEVGEQVWVIGDVAQTGALMRPLAAGQPLVQEFHP